MAAQELTLTEALGEAQRWVHALRSAEKLESVIATVLRAEALVADSERALREYDVKIGTKKSEMNEATVQLADVRSQIAAEQARLTAAIAEVNRVAAIGETRRTEEERETAARLTELANRVAEADARARQHQEVLTDEIQRMTAQRDAIKADIEALRRKVAGVGA